MSEQNKPWKSRLLDTLGIKSVAVETPKSQTKGLSLALAAAMTVALGGISLGAHAEDRIKKETASEAASNAAYSVIGIEKGDSKLERTGKVAATLGQIAMSPQTQLVSMVGQAAVGSAAGGATKSTSQGMHAAGVVGTVAGVAVAAPVFGVLMVASQAHSTYVFIQEEQAKNVKLKMEEVSDRVAGVKDAFTQQMRLDDRDARQSWPEDRKAYDQKTMYQAAVEAEKSGGPLSEEQQIRYDLEAQIAAKGGATEPWFAKFSAEKEQIAQAREAQTSQMLADAERLSGEKSFDSITSKIQVSAAKGSPGLATSNKGFADYAKEEVRQNDKNTQELGR